MIHNIRHAAAAAIIALGTMAGPLAAQETLTAGTAEVGSAPHYVISAFAKVASDKGLANIQVQEGMDLTVVLKQVGQGDKDMGIVPLLPYFLMTKGLAMFKQLGPEKGAELAANIQTLGNFNTGYFNFITFADSGIRDWSDLKGKRVFIGAPGAGAAVQAQRLIQMAAGLKPNDDYEPIVLNWGAGVQALLDGKVDAIVRPGQAPAPYINRLTAAGKVLIIGIPEATIAGEAFKKYTGAPGVMRGEINGSVYDPAEVEIVNAVNGNAVTVAIPLATVVRADMEEELAYGLTKGFIDSLPEIESGVNWAKSLLLSEGTFGLAPPVGLKMHPGAVRAWEEAGVTIPGFAK